METHTPGPAQLLFQSGDNDSAAFAALYDLTSPQVFGMLTALFPAEDDALQATTDAYVTLWRQAPHFTFDFNVDHADELARDRTVVAWINSIAQQTGRYHRPDATSVGDVDRMRAIAARLSELEPLTDAQALALTTVWLGGRTVEEAAVELDVALPTLKSRLRDAAVRLTRHYLSEITGSTSVDSDPLLATRVTGTLSSSGGQTAAFSDDVETDLHVGLGTELATLNALQALHDDDAVAVEAWINRQDRETAAQLRARTALLQRMLTWAYRRVAAHPPANLLDSVLEQLPEQNVGIEFIETVDDYEVAEDPDQQRRSRAMFIVVGAVLLIAVIVAVIFLNTGDQRIRSAVDDADDQTSVSATMDGASVTGHFSAEEDVAYLSFSDVADLEEDQRYQVWLFEEPGGSVVSVGTYTAQQLENGDVQFRGVNNYELLWITVEPETGSETPSSTALVEMPLQ
ncbi:MAG TPA: anti-sigma factor [Enteractinococcus helveticum]|uniref:Regulator of SigK n=1 Tax=Enteractinococcus helveticum TaxID=1837282 RepID=A0A921FN95_9MICC|nr:anti-sigma factor [Enteractinococcus helveticum]HJF14412.1 anti-sigma factor [Enteractinococcus helveticum]